MRGPALRYECLRAVLRYLLYCRELQHPHRHTHCGSNHPDYWRTLLGRCDLDCGLLHYGFALLRVESSFAGGLEAGGEILRDYPPLVHLLERQLNVQQF